MPLVAAEQKDYKYLLLYLDEKTGLEQYQWFKSINDLHTFYLRKQTIPLEAFDNLRTLTRDFSHG